MVSGFGSGGAQYTLAAKVESSGISQFKSALSGAEGTVGKFTKAISGASAVLGGSLVAGLGAAVNEARQFQSSMKELEKVAGERTAKEMSGAIKELATTIPLGQQALSDIAADAARFGVRGTDNITSFTEAVSKMSVATDLSASRAGESLAKLAELTGTPIESVESLGSSINQLSNSFATSSSEIVDSMLRSSAALSQLGVSQTDIAGLSAALNAVSESSSRAGSRMRRLAQEIVDPGKVGDLAAAFGTTSQQFKAMVKEDPTGVMVKMAKAMREGGARADALNSTLSTTSRQALSGLGQNLDGVTKALGMSAKAFKENTSLQSEFETATSTLTSQLKLVENRVRNIAISVGEKLLPILTDLLKQTKPVLSRVEDFASGLSRAQVEAAAAGSVIATVAGTVGWFATGPLGLAVGALGALTYEMAQHRKEIRSALLPVYDTIVDETNSIRAALEDAADAFRFAFAPAFTAFNRLEAAADRASNGILGSIQGDLVGGIRSAGSTIRGVLRSVATFFRSNASRIQGTLERLDNGVRRLLTPLAGFITNVWYGAWRDAETSARNFVSEVTSILTPGLDRIRGIVQRGADRILSAWGRIEQRIPQPVRDGLNTLRTAVLTPAFDTLEGLWEQHGGAVQTSVSDMATSVKQDPLGALATLATKLPGHLGRVASAFRDNFTMIETKVFPILEDAVGGIGDAIRSALEGDINGALNQLQGAFKDALKGVRTALVGEGGEGGILNTLITDMGTFLNTTGKQAIIKGLDVAFGTFSTALTETRIVLVGESGNGGILNQIITQMQTFLTDSATPILKAAGDTAFKTLEESLAEAKIALVGAGGGGGLINNTIGAITTYLKSDGYKELLYSANFAIARAIREAALEVYNFLIGSEDSFFYRLIQDIASYLVTDAWADLKEAGEIMWDGMLVSAQAMADGLFYGSLIKDLIGDIATYLKNTGKRLVKGAFDMIVGGANSAVKGIDLGPVKSAVQGVIDKANSAIKSLNNIPSNISTTVTRNVRTVRTTVERGVDRLKGAIGLQHGGIVQRPTRAVVGEAGPEAVAPLDELPGILAEAAEKAGNGQRGGGGKSYVHNGDIVVQSDTDDPEELGRALAKEVHARF